MAGRRQPHFLGFSPSVNSLVVVGLLRVTRPDGDPNRTYPARDATKTTRAAALGMKLAF